jgi:hypothetical protein
MELPENDNSDFSKHVNSKLKDVFEQTEAKIIKLLRLEIDPENNQLSKEELEYYSELELDDENLES